MGLSSIIIPNSVTTIGRCAFEECCNIESLTIGSGVKGIGEKAFSHTIYLKDVYCLPEEVPAIYKYDGEAGGTDAFGDPLSSGFTIYTTLHVPAASLEAYSTTEPWCYFKSVTALTDEDIPELSKCATPTIAYDNGWLVLDCETEGAECVYEIKCADVGSGRGGEVALGQTYEIHVHATLDGWEDSDVAVATIGWRNGRPVMEGFSNVTMDAGDGNADVNRDGTVDVADIASVIAVMAGKTSE